MITDREREALARMIDPGAFDGINEGAASRLSALLVADRILAAGWTPPVDAPQVATTPVVVPEPASGAQQAGDVREAAAKAMAFAGRDPNDMCKDAEEFWLNSPSAHDRYLAMADAAIRALPAPEVIVRIERGEGGLLHAIGDFGMISGESVAELCEAIPLAIAALQAGGDRNAH